jgi:hypothetical protein
MPHTPGPWYITGEDDRRYIREEASDACLALLLDGGHVDPAFALPEAEIAANGRLIAAAPEMRDDLRTLREECRDWQEALGDERPSLNEICAHVDSLLERLESGK